MEEILSTSYSGKRTVESRQETWSGEKKNMGHFKKGEKRSKEAKWKRTTATGQSGLDIRYIVYKVDKCR